MQLSQGFKAAVQEEGGDSNCCVHVSRSFTIMEIQHRIWTASWGGGLGCWVEMELQ